MLPEYLAEASELDIRKRIICSLSKHMAGVVAGIVTEFVRCSCSPLVWDKKAHEKQYTLSLQFENAKLGMKCVVTLCMKYVFVPSIGTGANINIGTITETETEIQYMVADGEIFC